MRYYVLLLRTTRTAGALGTVGWLGNNYYQQYQALANPEQVNRERRLGAMLGARDFTSDQVGFGVFIAIRLIHLTFGNIGEQGIGSLFNSPRAQELMRAPRTFENNRRLGVMEYQYWRGERGRGEYVWDEFMIQFGAHVNPTARAILQEGAARFRDRLN
ncbi:hypothetical protein IQ37_09890 [Chryseobacterium piperi]|uniref:Uncharacterized protein n=1 Tax=Chryseobacterium piperi TaxID=558152 RepID=A0A086BIC0_9FLAO|nr:hypothetical protein [Chryseobacterium piperi]ASW72995.1 hypothetical protein CJF12_00960 [Chryseobacterium piperi]KFF28684.1 hypothetical protein IQ37_09890 [Chryseobacterium piperi]